MTVKSVSKQASGRLNDAVKKTTWASMMVKGFGSKEKETTCVRRKSPVKTECC